MYLLPVIDYRQNLLNNIQYMYIIINKRCIVCAEQLLLQLDSIKLVHVITSCCLSLRRFLSPNTYDYTSNLL